MLDSSEVFIEAYPTSVEALKESLYPLLLLLHTASLWLRCSSEPEALDLGFGHCLLSLDVFNPCKDVWVRLGDDFFHPGMPPFNIVVGSGHVLVEIVPVIWGEISIHPGGTEVSDQLIDPGDVWGVLLDGKPSWSNIL